VRVLCMLQGAREYFLWFGRLLVIERVGTLGECEMQYLGRPTDAFFIELPWGTIMW